MPDEFPEAFKRAEQNPQVAAAIRNKDYEQVRLSMVNWGKKNWVESHKQIRALNKELAKRDISTPCYARRIRVPITIRQKTYLVNRDLQTGKFVSASGTFKPRPEHHIIHAKIKGPDGQEWKGMNYYAWRAHYPRAAYHHRKTTILIDKSLSRKEAKETTVHEIDEYNSMKTGQAYAKAHRRATKIEKQT